MLTFCFKFWFHTYLIITVNKIWSRAWSDPRAVVGSLLFYAVKLYTSVQRNIIAIIIHLKKKKFVPRNWFENIIALLLLILRIRAYRLQDKIRIKHSITFEYGGGDGRCGNNNTTGYWFAQRDVRIRLGDNVKRSEGRSGRQRMISRAQKNNEKI